MSSTTEASATGKIFGTRSVASEPAGSTTKVVILCGGLGTRLRNGSEFRPKPLVDIGGRPILWHIMKTYAAYGFKEFVLALGYKSEEIKDYFLKYRGRCALNGGLHP